MIAVGYDVLESAYNRGEKEGRLKERQSEKGIVILRLLYG